MTKTNNHELIKDILEIYNAKKYTRIGSDYSVTDLLKPVQIVILEKRYRDALIVDDIEKIIPALIGSATHEGLQHYLKIKSMLTEKYMIERRMLSVVHGKRLAGRFDILSQTGELYDIKVTKVWKYLNGGADEFEDQLNIYKWMLSQDGIEVNKLGIFMVLLDWMPSEVWKTTGYPDHRIQIINFPARPLADTKALVESRVQDLIGAEKVADNYLPKCTPEQRWAKNVKYKVFRKPSHKRAIKSLDTEARAKSYLAACVKNDPQKFSTAVVRKEHAQKWHRCQTWCPVANYCQQYKNKVE